MPWLSAARWEGRSSLLPRSSRWSTPWQQRHKGSASHKGCGVIPPVPGAAPAPSPAAPGGCPCTVCDRTGPGPTCKPGSMGMWARPACSGGWQAAAAAAVPWGGAGPACMPRTSLRSTRVLASASKSCQAASHSQANWERAVLLAVGAAATLLRSIRFCAILQAWLRLLPAPLAPAPAPVAPKRPRHG